MSNDPAALAVAVAGLMIVYTTSVVSLVIWLASKFRSLESLIFREMDKHRREDDDRFSEHAQRLQILELEKLGYTISSDHRPRSGK